MADQQPARPGRATSWSLQREFARLLVLAVLLPTLVLASLALWQDVQHRRQELTERMVAGAEFSARTIDEFLFAHRAVLALVAEDVSLQGRVDDRSAWGVELPRLRRHYPGFVTVLASDAKGVVLHSDPMPSVAPQGPRRVDDRAYFQEPARTGLPYISDAFRGRVQSSAPLVAVSAPLASQGRFAGILQGSVPVETFARINSRFLRQRGYAMLLLDRQDVVIHASAGLPFAALSGLGSTGPAQEVRALPEATRRSTPNVIRGVLPGGADAYAVKARLESGWHLVLLTPVDVIARELRLRLLTLAGLLGLAVLAGLAASWHQLRLLTGSVNQLLKTLQTFADQHVADPIAPESMPRELSPLAMALNETSARLGTAYLTVSHALDEQTRLRSSLEVTVQEREDAIARRTAELREAVAELDRLSRTDALTGSLNYRGFQEAADRLWREARQDGQSLAVLALDIDYFKRYNDHYGHAEGDGALRRFAGAVRSALLHSDDVLARPGGEEFFVFLPGSTFEQALQVGERVCQRVRAADIAHAVSPLGRLTVSVGVAIMLAADAEPEDMLRRADAAMYRAKNAGRDQVSA